MAHSARTKATRSATWQEHRTDQRLALVLNGISDGLVMLDHDWRFLRVNVAAATFLRKAPEALLGRRIYEVFPGFREKNVFAQFQRALAEQIPLEFEEYCQATGVWYAVRCLPFGTELIVFFRDVSRPHADAEASKHILAQLRHSFAHDFTAPLRAQVSFAELLLRKHGEQLSDEARDYVHRILEGALRQAELIHVEAAHLQEFLAQRQQLTTPTTSV